MSLYCVMVKFTQKCFSYLIEQEICYLVLCERNYSKRLAFSYLEEIAQEFYQQYGKRVRIDHNTFLHNFKMTHTHTLFRNFPTVITRYVDESLLLLLVYRSYSSMRVGGIFPHKKPLFN